MDCDYTSCLHHPASSPRLKRYGNRCLLKTGCAFWTGPVKWILNCSVTDVGWDPKKLTDDELRYCIFKEKRKSGLTKLQAELRRREKKTKGA